MIKRKFSFSRLLSLIKRILIVWAVFFISVSIYHYTRYYILFNCPIRIIKYNESLNNYATKFLDFCNKYDFRGKWGSSDYDWEHKFHLKGDYKKEDCIKAYEKQETLEAVPYYGDPPQGITEKIWNPPNFRGMMGIRIVGEERKAPQEPNYPNMCDKFISNVIIISMILGLLPLIIFFTLKYVILFVFPVVKNKDE